MRRIGKALLFACVGLCIGAAAIFLTGRMSSFSTTHTNMGGPFSLVNHNGQSVTEKSFGHKYLLIYFGFTYCPAICPTELQKMAEAFHALPKNWQTRIQPLFISVDPERDTPEALRNYVDLFLPELVGLTGTPDQIAAVKTAYKIYAAKVPEGDSYTMDHSSYIYLVDPTGYVTAMFKSSDTASTIAAYISKLNPDNNTAAR